MANENAQLAEFADNLWKNFISRKHTESNRDVVRFYKAEVVSNDGNNLLTIQRPFDNSYQVPCTNGMAGATAGSQVIVLQFGNSTNNKNHIVIAKGDGNAISLVGDSLTLGSDSAIDAWSDLIPIIGTSFFAGYSVIYSTTITDADNYPVNTIKYLSSATEASAVAHLPEASAGYVLTFGEITTRKVQLFITRNTLQMYVRSNQMGTWTDWFQIPTQTMTTTFTAPTIVGSSCTLNYGGYYIEGKHVYIQMQLNLSAALSANTQIQLFSGLPNARTAAMPINAMFGTNQLAVCYVDTSGRLFFRPLGASVTTSNSVNINGHYTSA